MSTELARINRLPINSMSDLVKMGEMLSRGGIMGINNPADGFIVAATCHQTGMSLLEFSETYDIIQNKTSKKTDAMVASFNELGGEHEIVCRDHNKVAVILKYNKKKTSFELTWDEIKDEKYTKGSNGKHKENYSTPRRRMQMMWARLMSDAIRAVCPRANRGTYTPEEVMDFEENQPAEKPLNEAPAPKTPDKEPDIPVEAEVTVETDIDYSVCPLKGELFGKPWAKMELEHLEFAMNYSMDTGYKEHIQKLIADGVVN